MNYTTYVPKPHGNATKTTRPFTTTDKQVLNKLKQTYTLPSKLYKHKTADSSIPNTCQGILNPRDRKQVENHKYLANKSKQISSDPEFSTLRLAFQLGNV